jgi:hypothetical protein
VGVAVKRESTGVPLTANHLQNTLTLTVTIKAILAKRPYWSVFAGVQLIGCLSFLLVHNEFGNTVAMLLLLPGSFVGPGVVGIASMVAGGWDALPHWLQFAMIPTILLGINFATWYSVTILRSRGLAAPRPRT